MVMRQPGAPTAMKPHQAIRNQNLLCTSSLTVIKVSKLKLSRISEFWVTTILFILAPVESLRAFQYIVVHPPHVFCT